MTIKEAFEFGVKELNKEEREIETTIFLEKITGIDRKVFPMHRDKEITNEEFDVLKSFIERRKTGEPVQYIVNKADFYGLEFFVKKGVLIPRFDTENLVEKTLSYIKDGDRILDMCTGSGCIILTLLHYKKNISAVGCDISEEALFVAKENAEKLNLKADFVKSDLFEKVEGKFDIIVSNPPYIETEVVNTLETEVKDYEPKGALDGGNDGLIFYRMISKDAKNYLKEGGRIFFEIGYNQGESVPEILTKEGYSEITVAKDLGGNDRVVSAVYGG